MANYESDSTGSVLSSDWTGLSRHLIASFFPVRRVVEGQNVRWEREAGSVEVQAPLTEGQIEQTQNWNSPFEQTGAEARLSSLSAMLQTGSFSAILNALGQNFEDDSLFGGLATKAGQEVAKLTGLSGNTKLNSTQVFTGSPPVKLTFVAHFRALFDPSTEVERPVQMLTGWAMPKKLAADGLVANVARNGPAVRTVYASEAPQIIGMQYARRMWKPMVIESIGMPLTAALDREGRQIHMQVQMSVASLTALDQEDWRAMAM